MRVPIEFERMVDNLSNQFSAQTGLPKSNAATLRRLADKLAGKITVRGTEFDIALLGRFKGKK